MFLLYCYLYIVQELALRNILYLTTYCPTLRDGILELIIHQMLSIDVSTVKSVYNNNITNQYKQVTSIKQPTNCVPKRTSLLKFHCVTGPPLYSSQLVESQG